MPLRLLPWNRAPTAGPLAPPRHRPPVFSGLHSPVRVTSETRLQTCSGVTPSIDDRPVRGVHGGQHLVKARSPANRGVASPRQWRVTPTWWVRRLRRERKLEQGRAACRAVVGRGGASLVLDPDELYVLEPGLPRLDRPGPRARADRLHRRRLRRTAAARPPARDARAPAGRHLRRRPAARLSRPAGR